MKTAFSNYPITLHRLFSPNSQKIQFPKGSRGVDFIGDFIPKYSGYLSEMTEFINAGVIQQKDIQDLMKSRHDEIAWDYVLIDEAQDWQPIERDLIYKLFTPARVIIADGIDQMIRSQTHCNWAHNVPHAKTSEKRCLRQKRNLVEFVNNYAEEFNLGWELEPIDEYEGGKVIICTDATPYEIFKREYAACVKLGNRAYEMMFLSPPSLVVCTKEAESNDKPTKSFSLAAEFDQQGFKLWDGTRKDLRSCYPTDVNQHRLLQYDSCRGLECWTVTCLQLDEFVRYKSETYESESGQQSLLQEDAEDRKMKFVYLWSLLPLTRAIDTVIITLRDAKSDYAKRLRSLAEKIPDFVEWIE